LKVRIKQKQWVLILVSAKPKNHYQEIKEWRKITYSRRREYCVSKAVPSPEEGRMRILFILESYPC
jgi:hypothetical protein